MALLRARPAGGTAAGPATSTQMIEPPTDKLHVPASAARAGGGAAARFGAAAICGRRSRRRLGEGSNGDRARPPGMGLSTHRRRLHAKNQAVDHRRSARPDLKVQKGGLVRTTSATWSVLRSWPVTARAGWVVISRTRRAGIGEGKHNQEPALWHLLPRMHGTVVAGASAITSISLLERACRPIQALDEAKAKHYGQRSTSVRAPCRRVRAFAAFTKDGSTTRRPAAGRKMAMPVLASGGRIVWRGHGRPQKVVRDTTSRETSSGLGHWVRKRTRTRQTKIVVGFTGQVRRPGGRLPARMGRGDDRRLGKGGKKGGGPVR